MADSGTADAPTAYNNNCQVIQGPRYVAILIEMIHDVPIISLDGILTNRQTSGNGWETREAAGGKGEVPWAQAPGPISEYARHEGNYAMEDILKGTRAHEKAAAEAAKKEVKVEHE